MFSVSHPQTRDVSRREVFLIYENARPSLKTETKLLLFRHFAIPYVMPLRETAHASWEKEFMLTERNAHDS